ncbi:MAG: flagellin lysine-N-methylase [Clostridia bacterium]|nr:flagellin lysine-N-methylase [Clostridia bacterium]
MKEVEIRPTYYDKFKCSADKCLYSCCIHWNIAFDDKTIEKYANIEDEEFCEYVLNNISPATKKATLKKGYCPFLDTDSLCKIQKKCGEEYLCDTCKSFPRTRRTLGNIIKKDILISCPEVLKIIRNEKVFSDNYIVETNDKEWELLQLGIDNKKYFIELFNKLKFLYEQKYDYKKSMFVLLNFAEDCTNLIKKKSDKNFKTFKEKFNEEYFTSLAKQYNHKKDISIVNKFQKELFSFADKHLLNKRMYIPLETYNSLNFTDKSTIKQNQKAVKMADKLFNLKNLLFYIINITITDSIKYTDFLSNVKFAVLIVLFINLFAITQQDITKQRTNNNLLTLATCLFRSTFHAKFYDNIEESLSDKTLSTKNLIDFITSF